MTNGQRPILRNKRRDKFFANDGTAWEAKPFEIRITGVPKEKVITQVSSYLRELLEKNQVKTPEERRSEGFPMVGICAEQNGEVVIHQETGVPALIEPIVAALPHAWGARLTWLDISPDTRKFICNLGKWTDYALEDVAVYKIPHHGEATRGYAKLLENAMIELLGSPIAPARYWTQLVPRKGVLSQEQMAEYDLTPEQLETLCAKEDLLCEQLFQYLPKTQGDSQQVVLIVFVRGDRVRKVKRWDKSPQRNR